MRRRSKDKRAVTPQHRGRFPGFNVLDNVDVWDQVTAEVVLRRLAVPGTLAFFTENEARIARPLLDVLLAQDDEPRVPVLDLVDGRLAAGETDGWHYDDLPEDGEAWRTTLAFLDDEARLRHEDRDFGQLTRDEQVSVVQAVQDLASDGKSWHGWSATHVWSLWTRYACAAFYSHPWAWNEIGFPGPAYPRGYLNLGVNSREHWEVPDSGTEDSDVDPVTFAARVERARHEHQQAVGQETS